MFGLRRLTVLRSVIRPSTATWRRHHSQFPTETEETLEKYREQNEAALYWPPSNAEGNDERDIGDYPRLPYVSYQNRDPYAPYFDEQSRRNFGEALPEEAEVLSTWYFDQENTFSMLYMLTSLGAFMAIYGGIVTYCHFTHSDDNFRRLAVPRDLPYLKKEEASGQ